MTCTRLDASRVRAAAVVLAIGGLVCASCEGGSTTSNTTAAPAGNSAALRGPASLSIVQLGDSVASGEGTLYGFSFDSNSGQWGNPTNPMPTWEGPYQDCHQSRDAYSNAVGATLPGATVTQLACTGATFDKGIAGPWSNTVPAEFGAWDTRKDLNQRYDQARPDVVLVTLGADDVQFVDIVTKCIEAFSATQCTAASPDGPNGVIKQDFTDYLPTLDQHLTTLAGWIEARAKALGNPVPKIVFTTYPDPLPSNAPAGGTNYCPDTWLFYNDQVNYLSSLVQQLDDNVVTTLNAYAKAHDDKNLSVVDLANLYDGHQWCATNPPRPGAPKYVTPWAYGLSIYKHYTDLFKPNPAAFHPTSEGQQAIAQRVRALLRSLSRKRRFRHLVVSSSPRAGTARRWSQRML